jgi:hypothetical protein
MQPVTVAISPTGIQYLLKSLLGDQIAQALQSNLTPPDYQFNPPNFNYIVSYPPQPGGDGTQNDCSNISVKISGGQFNSFSPAFSSCQQGPDDNSQFTVVMTISNLQMHANWNENYTQQPYGYDANGSWPDGGAQPITSPTWPYIVNVPSLTITAVLKLSASAGSYGLSYVSSSANAGNPQPSIPSGSVLNNQDPNNCGFGTHISAATVQQIDSMNYGDAVAAALKPIFATIGESGQLGPVTFDFLDPSDTQPVFPTGGGIQLGAKGLVSVNGSAFPLTPPADLPFPPIPTGNPQPHVTYFVQDYEVNALFWGFFFAGVLKATLTHGDLSDPQALETETYTDTSLDILPHTYGKKFMTADLTALMRPTVSFTNIYQFTNDNLAKVQQDVGGANTTYGQDIALLTPGTYSSQAGLEAALKAQDPGLMQYAAKIEQDIQVPGVVVNHMVRCVLNVVVNATDPPVEVIIFDVLQIFVMQGLGLGVSSTGKTQSLTFTFRQPEDFFPQATFVSSIFPEKINPGDFNDVWNALRPNWQNAFSAIGSAGLPLPRIPGFDFLFDQADIAVTVPAAGADGYISITTNVTYSPEQLAPAVRQLLAQQNILHAA